MSWVPALIIATVVAAQDQASSPVTKESPTKARSQSKEKPTDTTVPKKGPASPTATKPTSKSKAGAKASDRQDQKPATNAFAAETARRQGADGSDGVEVRTQAEMQKRKSPFLMMPGSDANDRYNPGESVDWRAVPPWRQASFFGIRERGLFFVYVVDSSGSMIDEARMPRATMELRRSVMALQPPQRFEVIFYNHESNPMPGGPTPRTADLQSKNLLLAWLRLIEPDGGTDPRVAVRQALGMKPDAVFLLSDGAFPQGTVEEITSMNTHKVPIHCVDLTGGMAGDHLKRIAAANGGRYVPRPLGDPGRR
jgi:hypothetical protein